MVKPFYKPLDRPEREEIWYCYFVPDRKQQDLKPPRNIPISQVPDLTKQTTKESRELHKNLNRGRVLETDSKYLKLAKTGGRKNLLWYRENERQNTGPKAYKVPDWYYHNIKKGKEEKELSEEEKHKKYNVTYGKQSYKTMEKPKTYERPDYMTHLEPEALKVVFGVSDRNLDRPIFGYDSFSFWKRNELEKSNKLPALMPEIVQPRKKSGAVLLVQRASVSKEVQAKRKVKPPRPKQSTKEIPGHRKLESLGYITKWHEKWYVQAARN